MKFSTVLAGALASVASAHSDARSAGMPKLMGGRKFLSEMKARNALPASLEAPAVHIEERQPALEERQTSNGRCGKGIGSCTNCCSAAGYCGSTSDYCAAPDCQFQYGPLCDANKKPSGNSTAGIARPQLGSIEYGGVGIYDCEVPGDVAFTFDDGPYLYTADLLDKLKAYNAKATFFITGNNLGKGPIDTTVSWSSVIKRMATEGHQIASHTWSHQNLSSLDATIFSNQMVYNEMAFNNILGYFPTYMRPPYSDCSATCQARLKTLGYHITYFDLDTAGYLNDSPTLIQNSKNVWDAAIKNANPAADNFLEIEHDIHYQTVYNLTDYILASMYKNGFKSVTVGDCLGDPAANWYRSGNGNAAVPPTQQTISIDGSCSSTVTCIGSGFGNCCSQYGFCGSTADYCGTGCQAVAGTCGSSSSSSSVIPTTSKTSPSTSKPATTNKTGSTSTTKALATPTPVSKVSPDGTCGGTNKYTCTGSKFGTCCSLGGRCGNNIFGFFQPYCGAGCQKAYGTCN